jgi:predicted Na+-dependent transporter
MEHTNWPELLKGLASAIPTALIAVVTFVFNLRLDPLQAWIDIYPFLVVLPSFAGAFISHFKPPQNASNDTKAKYIGCSALLAVVAVYCYHIYTTDPPSERWYWWYVSLSFGLYVTIYLAAGYCLMLGGIAVRKYHKEQGADT